MKKHLFKALLLSLICTNVTLVQAQPGPGSTGSKATNSDGSLQSSGPGTQTDSASSPAPAPPSGSNMSSGAVQNNTAVSRNPTTTGAGTSIGPGKTTGTGGLSSPDGEGGGGMKSSVTENNGVGTTPPAATESQRGAAPAGASSAPKSGTSANHSEDVNGSGSGNGGVTSITGGRQDTTESVPGNTSGSLAFYVPVTALLVGVFLVGAFWMRRREGDKRKP